MNHNDSYIVPLPEPLITAPVTSPGERPHWPNPPHPPHPDPIKDELIRYLMEENKRLREELELARSQLSPCPAAPASPR